MRRGVFFAALVLYLTNPNYRDGRKKKYTPQQMEHALAMLKKNSYNQVAAMTGISKSTLIRANKEKIK